MAITLKGFAQALIKNINLVAKQNDPQLKLTPTGFLRLLIENNAVTEINNIEELRRGQNIPVKLRYLQRGLESEVTTTDDCDTPSGVDWKETTITHPLFAKIGLFISDDEFRQYEEEATQTLALGDAQQAPLMRGFYEKIMEVFPDHSVYTRTWHTNISHLKVLDKLGFSLLVQLPDHRGPGMDTVYYCRELR